MKVFALHGLSGARIDEIAAETKTSKRMIYYYFGDKEQLYAQTLEMAYATVRDGEKKLDLAGLPAAKALAKLVGFTFDHHRKHPDFIRMVMIENIHHADYLLKSDIIRNLNSGAIENLTEIIKRGEKSGAFRTGLDPISLHWQISAMSFFNVSNKPTFSALFGASFFAKDQQAELREQIVHMILSHTAKS
ncbi:MAG: TetR family transcriptional regulator [Rhodobacteraceae bacterium]|nr:TetR family transcriptional regulator [Paracoccaceae bacterium]MBL4810903.1 TetR family transcriptional regulator [Paracoccaceae bacterium]